MLEALPILPHVCDSLGKLENFPYTKTNFPKKRIDKGVCLLDEFFLLQVSGQEQKIQPVLEGLRVHFGTPFSCPHNHGRDGN